MSFLILELALFSVMANATLVTVGCPGINPIVNADPEKENRKRKIN